MMKSVKLMLMLQICGHGKWALQFHSPSPSTPFDFFFFFFLEWVCGPEGAFQTITLRRRANVVVTTVEARADDQHDCARWSGRR